MGFLAKGADVNGYRKNLHVRTPTPSYPPRCTTNVGAMPMLQDSVAMLITLGYLSTLNYIMKSRWLSPYIAPSAKDKRGYGYLIGVTIDQSYHTA